MELQKPAPNDPAIKPNNASAPNDKAALGVEFGKVTVNQSQTNGGNVNVGAGVPVK
jgi:hypothetical protein